MEYNVAIITGASRGLGYSLVKNYCNSNYKVISIARNKSNFIHKNHITNIQFDLSNIEDYTILEKKLEPHFIKKITKIVLINNAGDLGKITPLKNLNTQEIDKTIRVNLTAPLILTSLISNQLKNTPTTIYNISSGAALKPYFGWVNYCASKAGIELATKTIAIEQEENSNFAVFNINPGVMDTKMQEQIRKSNKKDFKQLDRFISLKRDNLLVDPNLVAKKIISIQKKHYKSGSTIVIKDI